MFVIRRTDQGGGYVRKPLGHQAFRGSSYTHYLQEARIFTTREEAERERCPGNEAIVPVARILAR